jgi:hypothetical protein
MNKHTPAPWHKDAMGNGVSESKNKQVCRRPIGKKTLVGQNWEANAQLIAAAPDLLEALKAAARAITELQYDHNTCQGDCALSIAANAIAKATGEQL